MRNIFDNNCRENLNTFYVQQFFSRNGTVNEIMWKNLVQPDISQITETTDTHLKYVTFTALPGSNGYANAFQCYVIRTLSVMFLSNNFVLFY